MKKIGFSFSLQCWQIIFFSFNIKRFFTVHNFLSVDKSWHHHILSFVYKKRQFWLESLLVTDALTQWCVTHWLIDAWHTDVLTHVAFAVSVNLAKSLIGSSVTMYLCHSTTLSHRHIIAEVLNYNWTSENGSDWWKILLIYSNGTKWW